MKRRAFFCAIYFALLSSLFCIASCTKTDNTPPGIVFNSTPASPYPDTVLVYRNTTLAPGTHFLISLTASKAGDSPMLDSAVFTKSVNGGPDSVFQNFQLSVPYFYGQYFFTAGDSGNVERYKFSFWQSNGFVSSDSIVIKDSI